MIKNFGRFWNQLAHIKNSGTFINSATLFFNLSGKLTNNVGGIINNSGGTITMSYLTGVIFNNGVFYNGTGLPGCPLGTINGQINGTPSVPGCI